MTEKQAQYWASIYATSSQVFLAVAAGITFTGEIDFNKALVVILNLLLTFLCWNLGWRHIK